MGYNTWLKTGGLTEISSHFLPTLKVLESRVTLFTEKTGRSFSGEYNQPERKDPKTLSLVPVEMHSEAS